MEAEKTAVRSSIQKEVQSYGTLVIRLTYQHLLSYSYLKTLLISFNEMATNVLIERLRHKADGKTRVAMKTLFGEYTVKVISKVGLLSLTSCVYSARAHTHTHLS